MARFNYVALDARGQEASGLLEAASSSAAISQLRQAGYFPTSVIEEAIISADGKEARRRAATAARVTKPRAKKGIVLFQRRKVKSKILMIFTRQLATLIDSGLPLLRSLNVLAKQERDKVMKNTIDKLADSVQSGSTFSDALALHPKIFNDLYVNMVKAGEVGGVLELVLTRLSEFQEKAAKIKNKVHLGDGVPDHRDDDGGGNHVFPPRVHCAAIRSNFSRPARRQTTAACDAVRSRRQRFHAAPRLGFARSRGGDCRHLQLYRPHA